MKVAAAQLVRPLCASRVALGVLSSRLVVLDTLRRERTVVVCVCVCVWLLAVRRGATGRWLLRERRVVRQVPGFSADRSTVT